MHILPHQGHQAFRGERVYILSFVASYKTMIHVMKSPSHGNK